MELNAQTALVCFSALSQPTRLDAFRLLVRAGDTGLAAGEIASELGTKPNTTSQNLSQLVTAGLLTKRREGRSIRYTVNWAGVGALLQFLLEDCCGGQAELCDPVIRTLNPCCLSGDNAQD